MIPPTFIPRAIFPQLEGIPRTYFLGHHKAGLDQMKKMISMIDLVIECRDYRIPATSINPMLDEALGEKTRYIVYTKRDLGGSMKLKYQKIDKQITKWDRPTKVFFTSPNRNTMYPILDALKKEKYPCNPVVGARVLVVGMPNIGKSSLINALRFVGRKKGKAARIGADPGVTRKVGGPIKILHRERNPVYIVDTPGVFVPYMPDSESMLKLALCSCIKNTIISRITLADYLLYQYNRQNAELYAKISPPTNDIMEFLEALARKRSFLAKGGVPDIDTAASRFLGLWRNGLLGTLILDDVDAETLKRKEAKFAELGMSMNQAKKAQKEERKKLQLAKLEKV
ncbi:Mitochondrial GTPase [Onygenales sp. PD_12]|nr:Mitochondrial GTPase [Onygenales sp. PD_12]